jgi:serine/threonine protein kinase
MMGEVVGGYRLTQKLGEGSAGEVYVGEHASSGQKAAVKILFQQLCMDAALLGRLFDDVKVASLVNHSGIADLYDCGLLPDGRGFLIFEQLQGKTLTDALIELGQVSDVGSLADIAWQLAIMLRAAHQAAIVHAALKPDAVFLTFPPGQAPRPLVKLLDFGMANFRLGVRQSQTGSLLGAPLYMSPEIGRGIGPVDHRADIYSLGCIMFEMACGRPPFIREGQGELIIAHATEPAPFVSSLEPSIPPAIDQLIGRMLTKNPLARPQDTGEIAAVLEKFFDCPASVAELPAPPPVFPQPNAVAQEPGPPLVGPGAYVPPPPMHLGDPREATAVLPPPCAEVVAPSGEMRHAPEPTALLPPEGAPWVSSTALLPPDPQSSWLARVWQRSVVIEPGAGCPPAERLRARTAPEGFRSATPKRAVERHSVPRKAVIRSGGLPTVNLLVVVVSAIVLLTIAAVVLLARRDSPPAAAREARPSAAIHFVPAPRPAAPPSAAAPAQAPVPARAAEARAAKASPAKAAAVRPRLSARAAPEGDSDQPEVENAVQDGRRAESAAPKGDGRGKATGRLRRRW